jgi:hypothetical protein
VLAKAEHKRFMTYMLQSPAHIICCTRAREKTDFSDTSKPRPMGIQPIQEKNFSFEATVSLMMQAGGTRQDVLKCPAELLGILGRGQGYITAADGLALRAWVDGAAPINPDVERARGMLQTAAMDGLAGLRSAWETIPTHVANLLPADFLESVKACAEDYDRARAEAEQAPVVAASAAVQRLNAKIAAAQASVPVVLVATESGEETAGQDAEPAQTQPPAKRKDPF